MITIQPQLPYYIDRYVFLEDLQRLNIKLFWDVASYNLVEFDKYFRGVYVFHDQDSWT